METGFCWAPTPEFRIPEVWVGLEIDISNKLSADATTAQGPHLENHCSKLTFFFSLETAQH